jgi:citronellyl-CoA synthetase
MPEQQTISAEVARVQEELSALQAFATVSAQFQDPCVKQSIGLRFQEMATRHNNKPAILVEASQYTWRELNRLANRYANALASLGVRRGDVVSIQMDNRIEFIASLVAVAKLGGASAMINTQLSGPALLHCYELASSDWCIVGEECLEAIDAIRDRLPVTRQYLFVADRATANAPGWSKDLCHEAELASDKNLPGTREITQGEACFYLFTSGTTGLPKMARVTHMRALSLGAATGKLALKSSDEDRIYLTLPLYHGVGLGVGFCSTLITGASIVLRRRFSASQFLAEVRAYQATTFIYIGELCRYVMGQPRREDDADNPLRTIAGNGLRPDIWMAFKERYGIERVGEFYGASEGNMAMINVLNKDQTIGTPLGEMALVEYDLDNDVIKRDSDGRCIRVVGGGTGLMISRIAEGNVFEGYTDEKATEQKIVRDAFEPGDHWFNSGDLMREVDVGFAGGLKHYQFVDRVGDTFRWKSENVATCEVSEILNGFEEVDFCNVYGISIPGTEGRAGMAAIKLAESVAQLDLNAFSEYARSQLPHYAVPVFLRVKRDIDLTGTFKMVKGELREEGYDPAKVSDPLYFMAPGSDCYEPLSEAMYRTIANGQTRF